MKSLAKVAFIFLCVLPCFGQIVYVHHSGSDPIGQRIAFALKNSVIGSHGYRLVDSVDTAGMMIDLSTIDPLGEISIGQLSLKNSSAAVSVVVTINVGTSCRSTTFVVIYHRIYIIGSSNAEAFGKALLAEIDERLSELRSAAEKDGVKP